MPNAVESLFKNISKLKVLVLGDVMIDAYMWGKVDRISPEAPVPVVAVTKRESRLGGAANVAINIQALGATPYLCGIIGNDTAGSHFIELMKGLGLNTSGVFKATQRKTTIKTRVIGNNHQLMRVDDESLHTLSEIQNIAFIKKIKSLISRLKIDVIIFEDYDKGALNGYVIDEITATANAMGISTTVDPKKKNFMAYKNVTLFKPNFSELKAGLKLDALNIDAGSIHQNTKEFCRKQSIEMLMVTLSEHGVYYSTKKQMGIVPAHIRNISDVSGAGDTVISVASCCLALQLQPKQIAAIANLAGGLVCEKVGVVPIDKNQLMCEVTKELIL
jgi:rfaE bifunctional protein kinase chain/domain